MKLAEWIEREGLPVKQVAERSGVKRGSVINVLAGVPLQKYRLAARLVAFTGGEVTLEELADPDGSVRRRIAAEVVPWARQKVRADFARDEELRQRARDALELLAQIRELAGERADFDVLAWAEAVAPRAPEPEQPDDEDEATEGEDELLDRGPEARELG